MLFRMLYDEKLAQASYFIGCQKSGEAIVIDPQRDVDRYLQLAEREEMRITGITETHIHADFLSGARELAERTGARLYLSDEGDEDWKYQWLDKKQGGGRYDYRLLKDGDAFSIGNIKFEALSTPGHTPEHISFLVTDQGGGVDEPMGIATGDFIFVGDMGRPDLLETAAGLAGVKEKSARTLYRSLQKFKGLPDYLQVWPGHGAGSACGKALGAVPQSTVGYEKRFNPTILTAEDEVNFIRAILYGQPEPPPYFARMKRENKEGPVLLGALPRPRNRGIDEVKSALVQNRAVLLDTRDWERYRKAHLKDSLYAPLDNSFPTVAGSYVTEDQEIFLVVEESRLKEAVIDLIRIGLDKVTAYLTPDQLEDYLEKSSEALSINSRPIIDLQDPAVLGNGLILDVRRADEFDAGHLEGAQNVAFTRLVPRLQEIPQDRHLFVHCRTDNRSAYAAAFLESRGFTVTHLQGGYADWLENGRRSEND